MRGSRDMGKGLGGLHHVTRISLLGFRIAQRRYGGQNGRGSLKRYASLKKGFVHVKKCNRDIQYINKNVYISHFTICKQQNLLN